MKTKKKKGKKVQVEVEIPIYFAKTGKTCEALRLSPVSPQPVDLSYHEEEGRPQNSANCTTSEQRRVYP
jgi:hypothetical protein